jgi:hypothetical protein
VTDDLEYRCWYCSTSRDSAHLRVLQGPEAFVLHWRKYHKELWVPGKRGRYGYPGSFVSPIDSQRYLDAHDFVAHLAEHLEAQARQRRLTKDMKGGKSKRNRRSPGKRAIVKGSSYERQVCLRLNQWVGGPFPGKLQPFMRTRGSGADPRYPLDLDCPDDFPWLVEAKKRESKGGLEGMERALLFDYPPFLWMAEAEATLQDRGILRPVLLIMAKNHFPDLVAMRPLSRLPARLATSRHALLTLSPTNILQFFSLNDFLTLSLEEWRDHLAADGVVIEGWPSVKP